MNNTIRGRSYHFLIFFLIFISCNKNDDPAPKSDEENLINQVIGEWIITGAFETDYLGEQTVVAKKVGNELEISGNGFPPFKLSKFNIGYPSPNNKDDYIISSEAVIPNDGIAFFYFPEQEILVNYRVKDGTEFKIITMTGTRK